MTRHFPGTRPTQGTGEFYKLHVNNPTPTRLPAMHCPTGHTT